jgi:Rieske Fe-S protein
MDEVPGGNRHTRREAVLSGLGAIAGFLITALGAPLAVFLFGPAWRGRPSWPPLGEAIPPTARSRQPWVRVGTVATMTEDAPALTTVSVPAQDGWVQADVPVAVYVRRLQGDHATILDIHCTHMGCPVQWNGAARRFFCPCHGGVFDETGRVLSGPPPRPLDRYVTKIDGGVLYMGDLELQGS